MHTEGETLNDSVRAVQSFQSHELSAYKTPRKIVDEGLKKGCDCNILCNSFICSGRARRNRRWISNLALVEGRKTNQFWINRRNCFTFVWNHYHVSKLSNIRKGLRGVWRCFHSACSFMGVGCR